MNDERPNAQAHSESFKPDNSGDKLEDAKAAYNAKQAKDIKESKDRINSVLLRHESAGKTIEETQAEGHLGHTHDHLPPQLPFHSDKHESDKTDASQKSAPSSKSETQVEENDYYNDNGMGQ
jgi:hypothetical protein